MNKLKIAFLLFFLIGGSAAASAELEISKSYRALTEIEVKSSLTSTTPIFVGAESKFMVLELVNDDNYAIVFERIYYARTQTGTQNNSTTSTQPPSAEFGRTYILPKKSSQNVTVANTVVQSLSGFTSGPLVVPFKYRLNDDSISGESTLGYYAGWNIEDLTFGVFGNRRLTLTPFLSAGLTQVSVSSIGDNGEVNSDTKTGVTWAGGLLLKNWDNLNIGLVYGQDRIGDGTWEHEGEGWISLSVGWEF